jgi:hypothetical protein
LARSEYHAPMSENRDDLYSDEEAERRATEALRRSLTAPYKPQRELVGKGRPAARKPSKSVKKAKKPT